MYQLSQCPNIIGVKIFAFECIFGVDWNLSQVYNWVRSVIEIFCNKRCMFGSHMPIAKLSRSFSDLYQAYQKIISDLAIEEQKDLFHDSAQRIYKI